MLTKRIVEKLAATGVARKVTDERGLYLYLTKDGGKSWRHDFRLAGKAYTITYGLYPDVDLEEARRRHSDARAKKAQGINPAHAKKLDKLSRRADVGETFDRVAAAWYASKAQRRSQVWQQAHQLNLRRDLSPGVGKLPLRDITAEALLGVLEKAAKRSGAKTAERVRQTAIQVLDYGRRKLRVAGNVARALAGWIEVAPAKHRAWLKESELPKFLNDLEAYPGRLTTRLAVEFLLRTMVRKSELIEARWSEFDLTTALWVVPATRMKMLTEQKINRHNSHDVPLSRQVMQLLQELQPLTGGSRFLFPSNSSLDKPMSRSTLNVMFGRMHYRGLLTPHGIRATASTILNERGFRGDLIERQLAHVERNGTRRAYNHAKYLAERRDMMQAWSDILDAIWQNPSAEAV